MENKNKGSNMGRLKLGSMWAMRLVLIAALVLPVFLPTSVLADPGADIETLRPNEAGDETTITEQWPFSGEHWDKVDEVAPDGNGSTVHVYNTIGRDLYNLPPSSGKGPINHITVYAVGRRSGYASVALCIKSDGIITQDTYQSWASEVTTKSKQWTINPADNEPWEWADIDALQIGIALNTTAYAYSVCTQVYVEVDYTPGAPAAPTSVSATDGDHTDKVVITWTKSMWATDYQVYRDDVGQGWLGDVATFDDTGAEAPTITLGDTVATDGSDTANVSLSLSSAYANDGTTHTYKVIAQNASGESVDSDTNNGYRGVGELTYQWRKSSTDSDDDYSNIGGAIASTYDDTDAPAPAITPGTASASDGDFSIYVLLEITGETGNEGDGRYYNCVLNAIGATEQTSTSDRGYRGIDTLTYQWKRSSTDSDNDFSNIVGATTDPYSDTGSVVLPDGRYYYAEVSMPGAITEDTTHDRGYRSAATLVDGEDPRDTDLVYIELRPHLDETSLVGHGVPDAVQIAAGGGIFKGFSLPIWDAGGNVNEELYFNMRVPDRWDGENDPVVEVIVALAGANEKGNTYQLDLRWEKDSPNEEAVPATGQSEFAQRHNLSDTQNFSYKEWFIIDYDVVPADPLHIDDLMTFRIRRSLIGGQYNDLDGELIILHVGVLFPRGDLLGEEAEMENIGISLFMLVLAFLALGLTAVMFATRNAMLGFPCVIFWSVLGAYAYGQFTTAWVDWQYYLFFASFGMVIFCALAAFGLREKRDTLADESMDEEKGKGEEVYIDEEEDPFETKEGNEPSARTKAIRERARLRRTK